MDQSEMIYRREIDGLRALAVVPVIFFHAGFPIFRGGFIGVDVFFVISGYLITSIIFADLRRGTFSLVNFYERRARRILPALFVVMTAAIPFAYLWMMPDEFKNFGQSLLATAAFSNNILLAITSDYWAMASEFKPLLHTWSLAVEEQYYLLFPLLMIVCWRRFANRTAAILAVLLILSLAAAVWGVAKFPAAAFYLLPTRAWEILLGALVAFNLSSRRPVPRAAAQNQAFSLIGGAMIVLPVFCFNEHTPSPGATTLVPAIGTALLILFAVEGTIVNRILSNAVLVGTGLISYSLYLWHQPLFAFARIYSVSKPGGWVFCALTALAFVLAYLTWRFVEIPFRRKAAISRRTLAVFSVLGSLGFVLSGFYLNASYGMAWRVFDPQTRIQDMDKRAYNERVFRYKKEAFSSPGKLKLLVVGNSFARDFINMTLETFDVSNLEILYRNDLSLCFFPFRDGRSQRLFGEADIIVFADGAYRDCIRTDLQFATTRHKKLFVIGTKSFGYNLNYLIRLAPEQRRNRDNPLTEDILLTDRTLAQTIPAENYISMISAVERNGRIPITDDAGRLLTTDRVHLTKYGAIYFGNRVLKASRYGAMIAAGPHR